MNTCKIVKTNKLSREKHQSARQSISQKLNQLKFQDLHKSKPRNLRQDECFKPRKKNYKRLSHDAKDLRVKIRDF